MFIRLSPKNKILGPKQPKEKEENSQKPEFLWTNTGK